MCGVATDADGTPSGSGLAKTGAGTYGLATTTPATLSAKVQALHFNPTGSTSTQTTFFTLTASQTAGTGLDTIMNFSLTNGDVLNLTQALTASGWNFQAGTLADYLKVTEVGNNATIGIAVGGNVTTIADLVGVSNLTLAKLLPHIIY